MHYDMYRTMNLVMIIVTLGSMMWVMNLFECYHVQLVIWMCWYHPEGELLSCLCYFVHIVKGSSATNPFDTQSFYFKKYMYVVINYQKGGDWKCNHALNHILMLMTTHMLGTNHVYQVYLRIMFQRPCAWIMTRDKKHITQEWRYKMLTSFMVCSWV